MKCPPPCVRRKIIRWALANGYKLCDCGKMYQGSDCPHCSATSKTQSTEEEKTDEPVEIGKHNIVK